MKSTLFTVGDMARELELPIHRVQYLIRSRNIQPTQRAGLIRLFDEATLTALINEANAIEARRNMGV